MDDELRRPNSILNELDQLHEVIDENRRLIEENPAELALQINLMSLECREQDLLEELQVSNKKLGLDTFDLDVAGKYVTGHGISTSVLGDMLVSLQDAVDSLAHSLLEGPSSRYGPIPESIRSNSRLNMIAACGGSFRIILSSDRPALDESLSIVSLGRLNKLIDCGDNKDLIKHEIEELGPRAIDKYKKFLETIYKNKSQIKLYDTIKPHGFETRTITPELAESIWKVIDREESVPDREDVFRGIIKGLNLLTYKFQFIIDGSEEKISGSFDPGLSEDMKEHFDTFTTAHIRISSKQNETTGELDKDYTLLDFVE